MMHHAKDGLKSFPSCRLLTRWFPHSLVWKWLKNHHLLDSASHLHSKDGCVSAGQCGGPARLGALYPDSTQIDLETQGV
jgi:hypothetical protein